MSQGYKPSALLQGLDSSAVLSPTMTPADMTCFKYAPVTSVDVEGSFSLYRDALTHKRRRLAYDNLSRIILSRLVCVCMCVCVCVQSFVCCVDTR